MRGNAIAVRVPAARPCISGEFHGAERESVCNGLRTTQIP